MSETELSEDEERELTPEEQEELKISRARICAEAEKKLTPLELEELTDRHEDQVVDLLLKDYDNLPIGYKKLLVYATYLRVLRLIRVNGPQNEDVSEEEEAYMRMLKKSFTFEDTAFILRRSSATVHKHLNAIPISPVVAKMLGVKTQR